MPETPPPSPTGGRTEGRTKEKTDDRDGGPSLPPLREVIARHGLNARRALGQNFLLDMNLTRRIARAAGDLTGATVFEIGPGPGGLTRALMETGAKRVIAVERDRRCVEALGDLVNAYPGRLTLIEGDALKTDFEELARRLNAEHAGIDAEGVGINAERVWVVANLPYNIATPLLLNWLRGIGSYEGLVLMFQKEVAARLAAEPTTSAYGRLSIITQWLCEVSCLFDVSPKAFVPPPKVTSTVIHLRPRETPLAPAKFEMLETITAAAFGQRRKMLRSALKSLDVPPEALLERAAITPTARAEEIDVAGFCALARAYDAMAGRATRGPS